MALEKIEFVDQIEVIENGFVHVRIKTAIKENGKEISSSFDRHVIVPGADCSAEDSRVKAICAVVHTPEVVAAYQAAQTLKEAAQLPALE
jgi:hypothetical protein